MPGIWSQIAIAGKRADVLNRANRPSHVASSFTCMDMGSKPLKTTRHSPKNSSGTDSPWSAHTGNDRGGWIACVENSTKS